MLKFPIIRSEKQKFVFEMVNCLELIKIVESKKSFDLATNTLTVPIEDNVPSCTPYFISSTDPIPILFSTFPTQISF